MKRMIAIFALLFAVSAFAQERQYVVKVFEIQHRDPHAIADAVRMLGSGINTAGLSVNGELHTITVRDLPENVAAIEQAIQRLDRPAAEAPNMELRVSLLLASNSPLESKVPEDLEPVVKQLRSTFRYTHYAVLASAVHQAKSDSSVQGDGLIEPKFFDVGGKNPTPYTYRLRKITATTGEHPSIDIDSVSFSVMPIGVRPVGFETRVSMRPDEKVVIGTTTMGEKAVIVVLSAKLQD